MSATGTVVSDLSDYPGRMAEPLPNSTPKLRGRHLAHRGPGPYWVVTLVAEVTAEEHIENLMEAVAMLAAAKGESGRPLALERETQRALMRRGIAVTVD